jgi:hypothetical protein
MEQEQRPEDNDRAPDDVTHAINGQGDDGKQPPKPKEQSNDGKYGKKTSLRRSWISASPLTRIEIFVGTVVAAATVIYYAASFYQTRANFSLEHRGYLVVDIATIHTATQVLDVTVENPGRSIAQDITVHADEATFDVNSLNGRIQNKFINGWGEFTLPPIYPSSGKTTFNIPLSGLDMERLKSATQYIYVTIRITYTDEASGEKKTIPPVCMLSVPVEPAHEVQWKQCNPSTVIPQMEKWNENENPKYRWPSFP